VRTGGFVLGPGMQMSAFLNEQPFGGPNGFQGTFAFTATAPISIIALRCLTNERNELLMSTLPVVPHSGQINGARVLPMSGDGGGWTTQVILENPGVTPLNGTIQFFGQGSANSNGQPLNMTINGNSGFSFNYNIPSFGSIRLVTE